MTAIMSKEQSTSSAKGEVGIFTDFSQKTTLHGVRNLGEEHVSWCKKICWLLLIMGFSTMTFIQVKQKIDQYRANPIVTNVDVDFFDNITLPAIAICNINLFRISYTSENIYDILEGVYSGPRAVPLSNNTVVTPALLRNAKGLNADQFLQEAAHKIDRMVLNCNKPVGACQPKDFTLLNTDYGICYAINTNINKPWVATSAGNSYGFSLLLNAETYETTSNPSKTAGFKVLIYNQTTKAMVGYGALDLAPGFMTQIGLVKQQNDKVDFANGGTCLSNVPLDNYPSYMYSSESCRLDLIIKAIQVTCGCRPYFAPNMTSEPKPRCTIEQHLKCVVNMTTPPANSTGICKENCSTISFKTTVSFSSLISANVKAIANGTLPRIIDNYGQAMEASSRVNPRKVAALNQVFANLKEANEKLLSSGAQPIRYSYLDAFHRLNSSVPCFSKLLTNYPNTLLKLTTGDMSTIINNNVDNQYYLNEVPMFADVWATKCTQAEQSNMTQGAWVTAFASEVHMAAEPLVALAKIFTPINYNDRISDTTEEYFLNIFDLMTQYSNGNITRQQFSEQFGYHYSNYWNYDFSPNFLNLVTESLYKNTFQKIQDITMKMDNLTFTTENADLIIGVKMATIGPRTNCLPPPGPQQGQGQGSQQGSGQSPSQCASKTCVTTLAQTAALEVGEENFQNFVRDLFDCLNNTANAALEANEQIAALAGQFDIALQGVLNDASDYIGLFDFDKTTFYQDNMAGVNIFFNDLSVEIWSQDQNYDVWSLACDVGGTMGLFLGASLMTVFEFIDLLCAICCRCKQRRQPSRNNMVKDAEQLHYDQPKPNDAVSTPAPMPFPR